MHKTLPIPHVCAQWFRWLGQFLTNRTVQVTDALKVNVASDWSVRLGKDRQSLVIAATVTGTLQLTAEQAAILSGTQPLPLAGGSEMRFTKPLLSLFNNGRIVDGALLLPDGLTIQIDGAPDPVAQRVEVIDDDTARVHLTARVALVPISITADLVPTR